MLRDEPREIKGDVDVNSAFPKPYVGLLLRPRYWGLRGGHNLEERELRTVNGVGTDDDSARGVTEQRLRYEGAEPVPFVWGPERGDGELDTNNKHTCAVVVLGVVLGQAKGGGAS